MKPTLRKRLQPLIRVVRRVQAAGSKAGASVFASGAFLSSVYYGLLNPAFRREHAGVTRGLRAYFRRLDRSGGGDRYLLRRNTHRLEKGLVMRPQKGVFALDYIEETVLCFERVAAGAAMPPAETGELRWAQDVLTLYFRTVGAGNPLVDRLRPRFEQAVKSLASEGTMVPYPRAQRVPSKIGYEEFYNLCLQRRSVRWYDQRPVPRDLIDKALLAAAQAPSACNRQPFEFRVFDDPALVQKVAAVPIGTAGFSKNFPCIVVLVGDLSAFFDERDRHLIYVDGSLAAMSFMLALETVGLSSCPINWPDIARQERRMAELLHLKPWERVVMLISVGYPDATGLIPYSQKKPLDVIRRYNE